MASAKGFSGGKDGGQDSCSVSFPSVFHHLLRSVGMTSGCSNLLPNITIYFLRLQVAAGFSGKAKVAFPFS